jgi:predicted MFS family arabinose efflux permease
MNSGPRRRQSTDIAMQTRKPINRSLARPAVLALLSTATIARLPLAMVFIALLVHVQRLSGSFAVAGIATGAYVSARAAATPLLGRAVDRLGQTLILLATASTAAGLLVTLALLPANTPRLVVIAIAAGIGAARPPISACLRALLPQVLTDLDELPAAYAVESIAFELTFIFGPPLALGIAAFWSTNAALAFAGVVLLVFTAAFAALPASRQWRPVAYRTRPRGGALRSAGMQTLVLILIAVGAVFGSVDVGVTAAAKALHSTTAAGPILALWGVGSLLGGVVAARLLGPATRTSLALLLLALAAGHLALVATTGSLVAMGAVLLFAGAAIAPTYTSMYTLVDGVTPAGTATEAFAWLEAAVSMGTSAGAACAGALAQGSGAPATFWIAGAAGSLALVIAIARGSTLTAGSELDACPAGLLPATDGAAA